LTDQIKHAEYNDDIKFRIYDT